ncbi:hypothetical protein WJX77_008505 [Trebouxia sp. C0004]
MPRPKLHRVACDCLDCEQDMSKPALSAESSAAARQDPPPKCLLVHAEPAWPYERDTSANASTSGAAVTPYLHRLAQQGCCGLVSYQESPQGSTMNGLAQVLLQGQHSDPSSSRLQVRYNQLQACFMSTCESASSIAIQAGMTILPIHSNSTSKARNSDCLSGWPHSSHMAQRAMEVLGLDASHMAQPTESHFVAGSNASNEDDAADLLMLHIAQPAESIQAQLELSESPPFSAPNLGDLDGGHDQASLPPAPPPSTSRQSPFDGATRSAAAAYSWLNDLVSCLWRMPAFHQSVLLVLLLTNPHNSDLQRFQANQSADVCFEMDGFPKVARPLQSHCISNMKVASQCLAKSSLMVQHLPGVVRCDNVQSLSLTDIVKHGGGCCILAEHILPELAYKLGRAAKYGA